MTETSPDSSQQAAERRGFFRGLNLGLVAFSGLNTLGIILRSTVEIPKLEQFFRGVKVQLPALTLLVLEGWPYVATVLGAGVLVCVHQTVRKGTEKRTAVMNVLLFGFSLGWWALTSLALQAPFWSLLEEIGRPRR